MTSLEALVFTSPNGAPLRHSNFYRRVWMPALELLGLVDLYIQDLRHAGNQLASDAGASLREMMERMGHDSTRGRLSAERKPSGTRMARKPRKTSDGCTGRLEKTLTGGFGECARQDSNP
jgi:integrase